MTSAFTIPTVALLTSFLLSLVLLIVFDPPRRADPQLQSELRSVYSNCLESGGGGQECRKMIEAIKRTKEGATKSKSACEAARDASFAACTTEWENQWYDSGSVDYPASKHSRDIPRCDRISQVAFSSCVQFR